MKSLFAIAVASLLVVWTGRAQQLNDVVIANQAFDTISTNYTFSAFTNATPTTTLSVDSSFALYHSVQVYATGACTYVVDRTINGTNWFAGSTNAVAAGVVAETAITGRYNQMRVRVQGTNVGGGISYLGGR